MIDTPRYIVVVGETGKDPLFFPISCATGELPAQMQSNADLQVALTRITEADGGTVLPPFVGALAYLDGDDDAVDFYHGDTFVAVNSPMMAHYQELRREAEKQELGESNSPVCNVYMEDPLFERLGGPFYRVYTGIRGMPNPGETIHTVGRSNQEH